MTALLADARLQAMLPVLLLTYCRVQSCLLAMPGFSLRILPVRLRVAIAMSMTPLLAEHAGLAPPIRTMTGLALLAGAEIVTGLILGGLVRLMALSLDIAAAAIAATTSLSQLVGGVNEFAPHPIGNLLSLAGLALLMALGMPALLCDLLRESLVLRPVGSWPQVAELLPTALGLIGRSFVVALVLAAPFILGGYLFQILTGMASKAMPALPMMLIAAPAAILLALVALTLLTPAILSGWARAVLDVMQSDLP
ncbi:flagellar biosynthetic protein FliR [Paracoccus sp. CPCC 101403]|uniref:Flagellar biosynthetic protein FliR n=1 Tax=Paracoccus broussonetiae TaxID=3075834 RepID=A0ABU3EFX9_9RHOB|nr:flagellar biosynthetic protein FliR [Paracoccus sp. CPCC 101403]MDT1063154.1 flagellar biosynthetic protein FliR [Paracoccus sp. CPCC 101403]